MGAALDLGRERARIERAEMLGLGGIDHADQARPQAGQGNQRERAGLGVELGRDAVVRPRMAEIERQRDLRIVAPLGLDAGGGAAERLAPVGADDEPRGERRAAVERDRDIAVARLDRRGGGRDPPQVRQRGGAAVERRDQVPVLDIVAEGFEPDLGRLERDLGRADQPRRYRRSAGSRSAAPTGPGTAPRPPAPRARRPTRTTARWCGCRPAARLRDQRGLDAGGRQRNRGGQPRRAAADHRHFDRRSSMRLT